MLLTTFPNREAAGKAAAKKIAEAIRGALQENGSTQVALSGGSSPIECYRNLSSEHLLWEAVTVFPTDERCVASDHADSNARMLQHSLLINQATNAQLEELSAANFTQPFAVVLLGMGEDGHFASIFPDSPNIGTALDQTATPSWLATSTAASEHKRESMNLSALLQTPQIILLAFGNKKKQILQNPQDLPVQHLREQEQTPIHVIWAE